MPEFEPHEWHDLDPLGALDLNRIEQGVKDAQDTANGLLTNVEQVVTEVLGSLLPESYLITNDNHLLVTRADGMLVDAGQLAIPGLSSGAVESAIRQYLIDNPSATEPGLAAHIASETPHPVYDDIPDLTSTFQNGLLI